MRQLLILSLLLLGGCTSMPAETDISGIWINQAAIDAAPKASLYVNP
ncbi:starvation-inducible outer membrane lipoprotein [Pseudomonas frederiksbergensis]